MTMVRLTALFQLGTSRMIKGLDDLTPFFFMFCHSVSVGVPKDKVMRQYYTKCSLEFFINIQI